MPCEVTIKVEQCHEFAVMAMQEGADVCALCRWFGISTDTGYTWIRCSRDGGQAASQMQSIIHLGFATV